MIETEEGGKSTPAEEGGGPGDFSRRPAPAIAGDLRFAPSRRDPAPELQDSIVACAECGARYVLPESLMGPRGARITCPACGARFDVRRHDPEEVAVEVVEALGDRIPAILIAQARGRLFAEGGELLFEAYDAWRGRVGPRADAGVFRRALRRRWDLDLPGRGSTEETP